MQVCRLQKKRGLLCIFYVCIFLRIAILIIPSSTVELSNLRSMRFQAVHLYLRVMDTLAVGITLSKMFLSPILMYMSSLKWRFLLLRSKFFPLCRRDRVKESKQELRSKRLSPLDKMAENLPSVHIPLNYQHCFISIIWAPPWKSILYLIASKGADDQNLCHRQVLPKTPSCLKRKHWILSYWTHTQASLWSEKLGFPCTAAGLISCSKCL